MLCKKEALTVPPRRGAISPIGLNGSFRKAKEGE